jgi:hypothetical protein
MIVPFTDSVTGTAVYINPVYVVALRPDPVDPDHITTVRLQDGESVQVRGDHEEVAEKLARAA